MTDTILDECPLGYSRGYSDDIDVLREREYPQLSDTTYLDHAGTTPYAKSLIDSFSRDLSANLFGNPHSLSASSQRSTQRVDDIRLRTLRFFHADPDHFDLVFVANATTAIKLVAEALRDDPHGFWYGYHVDAHTSLVGARELATAGSRCFTTDPEVEEWIAQPDPGRTRTAQLFAFPAQSNMNGRRLPLRWCKQIRAKTKEDARVYTLLDAASLVSSSSLDLSDVSSAPDFTVLSFYKIFGFPDLGALIVRKHAGHVFAQRRFFGGGTVDMVLTREAQWHAKKACVHEALEDGTLPFHNIIALDSAFETHARLYGSMDNVSAHARFLAKSLYDRLAALRHFNGERVCHFYMGRSPDFANSAQGPILAFNLRSSQGGWIGKSEVERLANVKNVQIRSGTLCNPGGAASQLGWSGTDMLRHFSAGMRCGDDNDIMDERPTGILRVSLGAMSNRSDVEAFMAFVEEFYVEKTPNVCSVVSPAAEDSSYAGFYVESLAVYPIKSCGAFKVPDGQRWEVRREGLAWDREWCLIHQGTGVALSQKKYPRMALIRPTIDLARGVLRVVCGEYSPEQTMEISLQREDADLVTTTLCNNAAKPSTVCGDQVVVQVYSSATVSSFFSTFLGVPCTLARFPPQSATRYTSRSRPSIRHHRPAEESPMPGSFPPDTPVSHTPEPTPTPILLSNESPILLISRSSVNRLNETIKAGAKKAVAADVFRANIIVAENLPHQLANTERPYIEDRWTSFTVGPDRLPFDVLGPCQRCQMVCIDQYSGARRDEPFSTLAKTRKVGSQIVFGRHAAVAVHGDGDGVEEGSRTVMAGDVVRPWYSD
ncbi:molybdenum cofactor sulfurase [Aspergillus ambiguus]|uniref:putative molybdenum cofactor sulfurase protein (HxB) n=1 Tax=Aspergillus ambiguus TaxID=176160 RepID=UPI003CCD77BF